MARRGGKEDKWKKAREKKGDGERVDARHRARRKRRRDVRTAAARRRSRENKQLAGKRRTRSILAELHISRTYLSLFTGSPAPPPR